MPRFFLVFMSFGLFVYAFTDWIQTPMPRNLSKPMWLLVIVLVPIIGPILWILFGAVRGGGRGWDDDDDNRAPDNDPVIRRVLDRIR